MLRFLPSKLVRPRARPPPISTEELAECGILTRATRGSIIFSDGAKAYDSYIKKQCRGVLTSRQVSHHKLQFTKKVRTSAGHSKVGGTQCIDTTWGHLEKAIPYNINTKKNRSVNPNLQKYVLEWAYRLNHRSENGFTSMAKIHTE